MANQKPVDEIRIGRVKATIWKNGTDEQPRHNVTFSRLYKDGDQWKSTQSFGRNDLLVLAKVADLAHTGCSSFRQKQKSRRCRSATPSSRPRARRSQSLRRACSFLPASIESLLVLPSRSQLRRHHSSLLLRSVGFPSVFVKGKHTKPSKETHHEPTHRKHQGRAA